MRWDPISRRLRELPSGRSSAMPILTYVFVLSALTVAAFLPSVPPHGMFSSCLGSHRLSGRRILDDPGAEPGIPKAGGVRHPSAGAGGVSGLCPPDGHRRRSHPYVCLPLFLERPDLPPGDRRREAALPPRRIHYPLPGPAERQGGGGPEKVPSHAADALTGSRPHPASEVSPAGEGASVQTKRGEKPVRVSVKLFVPEHCCRRLSGHPTGTGHGAGHRIWMLSARKERKVSV